MISDVFQYRVLIVDLPFQLGRSRESVSVEVEFARAAPPIAIGGANAKKIRQHKHSCRYLALVSTLAPYLVEVEELARRVLAYL